MSVLKTLHQMITTTMKWMQITIVFNGKNKTKRGMVKSSTHLHCRRQNILTKLLGVIGQTKNATLPFDAWNCLITDEISDKTVQHTNQYIFIIHPNFSCKCDAKLTDTIEVKAFIGLLCSAGVLWSNKKSLKVCGVLTKKTLKNLA
jgi:hypothetical protein